jgi:hypothetical protein
MLIFRHLYCKYGQKGNFGKVAATTAVQPAQGITGKVYAKSPPRTNGIPLNRRSFYVISCNIW